MMLLRLQTLSSILTMNTSDDDRDRLATLTRNGSAQVCLPRDLTDESLASLATDLRSLQGKSEADDGDFNNIDRPLYLLFELFSLQSEKLTGNSKFIFPLEQLGHWLGRLNHYVQRETVSRVIKQPCPEDTTRLLAEISKHVLAMPSEKRRRST